MNYQLGRLVDREPLMHLSRCQKCRKKIERLEMELKRESLEIREQANGFGLYRKAERREAV